MRRACSCNKHLILADLGWGNQPVQPCRPDFNTESICVCCALPEGRTLYVRQCSASPEQQVAIS